MKTKTICNTIITWLFILSPAFIGTGCTAIGLLAGAGIDGIYSHKKYTEINRIRLISPGTKIQLFTKSGDHREGMMVCVEKSPGQEYYFLFNNYNARQDPMGICPLIGDTLEICNKFSKIRGSGILLGTDPGEIFFRNPADSVIFSTTRDTGLIDFSINGNVLSLYNLNEAPTLSVVELITNDGTVYRCRLSEISTFIVSKKQHKGMIIGSSIGAAADIIFWMAMLVGTSSQH